MTATTAVDLPTEAEYQAAFETLLRAHDAVEALAWRVGKIDGSAAKPTRPATAADIGLLWSFTAMLGGKVEELNCHLGTLQLALSGLDTARIEGLVADA
jgi:hypothetical protein